MGNVTPQPAGADENGEPVFRPIVLRLDDIEKIDGMLYTDLDSGRVWQWQADIWRELGFAPTEMRAAGGAIRQEIERKYGTKVPTAEAS